MAGIHSCLFLHLKLFTSLCSQLFKRETVPDSKPKTFLFQLLLAVSGCSASMCRGQVSRKCTRLKWSNLGVGPTCELCQAALSNYRSTIIIVLFLTSRPIYLESYRTQRQSSLQRLSNSVFQAIMQTVASEYNFYAFMAPQEPTGFTSYAGTHPNDPTMHPENCQQAIKNRHSMLVN